MDLSKTTLSLFFSFNGDFVQVMTLVFARNKIFLRGILIAFYITDHWIYQHVMQYKMKDFNEITIFYEKTMEK